MSSYIAGAEEKASAIIQAVEIPTIGAISLYPGSGQTSNPYLFYLHSGVPGEAEALASHLDRQAVAQQPASILYAGESAKRIAESIKTGAKNVSWTLVDVAAPKGVDSGLASIAQGSSHSLLLLCQASVSERVIAATAASNRKTATILIPGSLASPALITAGRHIGVKVLFAFPDRLPGPTFENATIAEARILTEALTRAGQEVSRDKLIQALESMYEFESGTTPAISFGPNRRIGITGTRLVSVDPQTGTLQPLAK